MTLTRRSDLGNYSGLRQLNRVLDEAFGSWPFENQGAITSAWIPPCDIMEDAAGVRIVMEIPGVNPGDVKLSLENNMLTIRGEKRPPAEGGNEDRRVHRYERSYGAFERTFALPNTVDAEKVEAAYDAGMLTVVLPKAERLRPREITLKTGIGQHGRGAESAHGGREPSGGKQQPDA